MGSTEFYMDSSTAVNNYEEYFQRSAKASERY